MIYMFVPLIKKLFWSKMGIIHIVQELRYTK